MFTIWNLEYQTNTVKRYKNMIYGRMFLLVLPLFCLIAEIGLDGFIIKRKIQ